MAGKQRDGDHEHAQREFDAERRRLKAIHASVFVLMDGAKADRCIIERRTDDRIEQQNHRDCSGIQAEHFGPARASGNHTAGEERADGEGFSNDHQGEVFGGSPARVGLWFRRGHLVIRTTIQGSNGEARKNGVISLDPSVKRALTGMLSRRPLRDRLVPQNPQ